MASATPISALSLFFLLISGSLATATGKRRMVFYGNEVLYDGQHANRTILAGENHLGGILAFDDPINLDNNVHSATLHRAQSVSFYVIEGTGDFFIARGTATLMSNTFQGKAHFRLRIDINLYVLVGWYTVSSYSTSTILFVVIVFKLFYFKKNPATLVLSS
ncbi:hypothetical protein ACLB2K_048876 [Fragaria x ananassa]